MEKFKLVWHNGSEITDKYFGIPLVYDTEGEAQAAIQFHLQHSMVRLAYVKIKVEDQNKHSMKGK